MSPSALDPYLAAVRAGDPAGLAESLAEGVVLHGPLVGDPITGREQVAPALGLAFAVEGFRFGEIIATDDRYAVVFTGTIGAQEVEGMEVLHLDAQGKIDSFTAYVRPLAAAVALQNRMAPALGIPALTLTPAA